MAQQYSPIRVFIGSSSEGAEVAEHLHVAIQRVCEPQVWDQGVFELGKSTMDNLIEAARDSDFAILVLSPDDKAEIRGKVRQVPRDNVIFELGLFIGIVGKERTFFVFREGDDIKIPTDLLGVTAAPYQSRADGNTRSAITSAALSIKEAIQRLGHRQKSVPSPLTSVAPTDHSLRFANDLTDLLQQVSSDYAGIYHGEKNERDVRRWVANLLNMLRLQFSGRQPEAYTIWLRPAESGRLRPFSSSNLKGPQQHYDFAIGEGLAGHVWETGEPAVHWEQMRHSKWVIRPGCENATYLCVVVGKPGAAGGVLSVGSDSGFPVNGDEDLGTLALFASLLSLAVA